MRRLSRTSCQFSACNCFVENSALASNGSRSFLTKLPPVQSIYFAVCTYVSNWNSGVFFLKVCLLRIH